MIKRDKKGILRCTQNDTILTVILNEVKNLKIKKHAAVLHLLRKTGVVKILKGGINYEKVPC
jgi:hypothetical protein